MNRTVPRLFFALLIGMLSSQASALRGTVVGITDGDTITILDSSHIEHKVRLGGVDAPEKTQPFGNASKRHLSDLVYGKSVRVDGSKTDRYGRLIGKIYVQPSSCPKCGMTLDANLAQITAGLAWWYRKYAAEQSEEDQGRYEFAESEAKARRIGLWREANSIAPWDWRRGFIQPAATIGKSYEGPQSRCGAKQYCQEMRDCSEATIYLRQCGLTTLDRDKDGIPCESLCANK